MNYNALYVYPPDHAQAGEEPDDPRDVDNLLYIGELDDHPQLLRQMIDYGLSADTWIGDKRRAYCEIARTIRRNVEYDPTTLADALARHGEQHPLRLIGALYMAGVSHEDIAVALTMSHGFDAGDIFFHFESARRYTTEDIADALRAVENHNEHPSQSFTLWIKHDNDAFQPEPHHEIARILRSLAEALEAGYPLTHGYGAVALRDINGNTVGHWQYSDDRCE